MSVTLNARVKQKVDTEPNWLANPLILLDGEQAFVVSETGFPVNFKIGDGTKAFSDLDYWIDYASNLIIAPTAPGGTLPTPATPGKIMILGAGTYTKPDLSGSFTFATNSFNVIFWDGALWSIVLSVTITVDLTAYALKTVVDAIQAIVTGGAVVVSAPDDDLSTYTTAWAGASTTFWNDKPFTKAGPLTKIRIWCVLAGTLSIRLAHKTTGSVNVFTFFSLPCVLGLNTFVVGTDFPATTVAVGDVGGSYQQASGVGKIGYKSKTAGALSRAGSATSGAYTTTVVDYQFGVEFSIDDIGLSNKVDNLNTTVFSSDPSNVTDFLKGAQLSLVADPLNNVFSTGTIVDPGLVKSNGTVDVTAGWKYIRMLFTAASHATVYVANINIRPATGLGGYWRFINASGTVLTFGAFTSNSSFSLAIPATAVEFDIDIQAPGDSTANYANAVISYVGLISKIKGMGIAGTSGSGGSSFDQSLNTTNSVTFAGVTTSALSVLGLPTTSSGASIGGIWIDTANGNVLKVRTS